MQVADVAARISALRERLESEAVGPQAARLGRIFAVAERRLAQELTMFRGLQVKQGHVVRSVENIRHAMTVADRARRAIDATVTQPGEKWARQMVADMHDMGVEIAEANLRVPWLSPEHIEAVFDHVPEITRPVLEVHLRGAYQIMGTVGDDVQEWFRQTLLDAIADELPVQGEGSLAERIAVSGRIKPITVRTRTGGLITRSISTRANAIARVECAKVINSVHERIGEEALGDEAQWINTNPMDHATTPICRDATQAGPHPLSWWDASRFGRPPRLNPFHLCRSVLVAVQPEWLTMTPAMAKRSS